MNDTAQVCFQASTTYLRTVHVGMSWWSQLGAERAACNVGCSKGSKRKGLHRKSASTVVRVQRTVAELQSRSSEETCWEFNRQPDVEMF